MACGPKSLVVFKHPWALTQDTAVLPCKLNYEVLFSSFHCLLHNVMLQITFTVDYDFSLLVESASILNFTAYCVYANKTQAKKIIMILTFALFSGKGRHTLYLDTL